MSGSATHRRGGGAGKGGFTLIELLVAVSILALLIAIVIPSFSVVRHQARSLVCMDHLRTACFEFRIFADPYAVKNRGDSTKWANRFDATDFLDDLYTVDEFWDAPEGARQSYPPAQEPIMCPAGPRQLARVSGPSSADGGVDPPANISYAMNRRLLMVPSGKGTRLVPVTIAEQILERPNVPLLFDADGRVAVLRHAADGGGAVLFSAPPGRLNDGYRSGTYWHPSFRHRGKMNVGFVGGHVVSTSQPLADKSWDWEYRPSPG